MCRVYQLYILINIYMYINVYKFYGRVHKIVYVTNYIFLMYASDILSIYIHTYRKCVVFICSFNFDNNFCATFLFCPNIIFFLFFVFFCLVYVYYLYIFINKYTTICMRYEPQPKKKTKKIF